jgi:hypothetical protein
MLPLGWSREKIFCNYCYFLHRNEFLIFNELSNFVFMLFNKYLQNYFNWGILNILTTRKNAKKCRPQSETHRYNRCSMHQQQSRTLHTHFLPAELSGIHFPVEFYELQNVLLAGRVALAQGYRTHKIHTHSAAHILQRAQPLPGDTFFSCKWAPGCSNPVTKKKDAVNIHTLGGWVGACILLGWWLKKFSAGQHHRLVGCRSRELEVEGIALGQSDSKLKEIYEGGDLFFIALYSRRRDLLLAAVRLPAYPPAFFSFQRKSNHRSRQVVNDRGPPRAFCRAQQKRCEKVPKIRPRLSPMWQTESLHPMKYLLLPLNWNLLLPLTPDSDLFVYQRVKNVFFFALFSASNSI